MTWKIRYIALLLIIVVAFPIGNVSLVLAQPDGSPETRWPVQLFDDDDDWDDDDWDDDDWDDDDWDDDDWDDDDWDDDDWDDDDDCDDDDDWDDDDCYVYVHDRTFDTALPNQAILQLNSGVNADDFADDHDATLLGHVESSNLVLLQLDPAMDDQYQVDELVTDERVEWAELNYTSHAPEGRARYFFTSAELSSGFVGAPALPADLNYSAPATCADGSGVSIAVLDTGVDESHPLIGDSVIAGGMNTLDGSSDYADDGNGLDDDADGLIDEMVGHGTHVTGSILQVAPGAKILPFKVLNSDGVGTSFSLAAAVYLAVDAGVDVINLSLGSTYDSLAVRMAVEYADAEGVVVVAAAGNSNQYTPVEYPAAMDSVISVASVNAWGDKSFYSNFHETVSISAPGENVASAYPGGHYLSASGTSMAAPMVSGTITLLIDRYPDLTAGEIIGMMHASTTPLSLSDPLLEGLMGSGKLNIDASINCESGVVIVISAAEIPVSRRQ